LLESVDAVWGLASPVGGLELGRRDVPDRLEQAAVVEPVDPLQGGVFDVVDALPGAAAPDQLGLVPPDDGLGQGVVPPFFVFGKGPAGRDVVFLGLAAPGAPDVTPRDDLVAVWKTLDEQRFQNYRAIFTVLDVPVVSREWIRSILAGDPLDH